jgi:predicted house-cleaning noncanonical NTP pyrophosphatase (MazG superfamily)
MSLEDFRQALLVKVVEEASEVASAPREKLVVEIADLFEVLDSLIVAFELDPDSVRTLQAQRREDRGGFEKRLKLLRTD